MDPQSSPIACELFKQWQKSRGRRVESARAPFWRNWQQLLDDAGLLTATEQADAERDARELEADGWLKLKPVQYRPHLLQQVTVPLLAEERWCQAFGFEPPTDDEARQIREFGWETPLGFLREARLNIPFDELLRLNDFIKHRAATCKVVPIKERSLQIFGDEKRLDLLLGSALFRGERLDLARDLRCELIGVPLAWKRGPTTAAHQPVLVIENAATWHSYCRWNSERALFSAVVYGDGNRFIEGVRYLADIFAELNGPRQVLYFGDLDPYGVVIPQQAATRASILKLPAVEPHAGSYRALFTFAETNADASDGDQPEAAPCEWLGELSESARKLFSNRKRIAQEHIGWEFLCDRSALP